MQNMDEIYEECFETVYKYLFCLTHNSDISEELTQETFYRAVKKIDTYNGKCKISVWLCQIAKYIWYGKIKKDKRNKEIPIDELNEVLITNEEIEEKICRQEEKMELFKKMQKLDEESRNVMYLRILGNFNYEEIAEITGKTANWARVTFFRGKQKLKEENNNEK